MLLRVTHHCRRYLWEVLIFGVDPNAVTIFAVRTRVPQLSQTHVLCDAKYKVHTCAYLRVLARTCTYFHVLSRTCTHCTASAYNYGQSLCVLFRFVPGVLDRWVRCHRSALQSLPYGQSVKPDSDRACSYALSFLGATRGI